jgi:hypothetical protein
MPLPAAFSLQPLKALVFVWASQELKILSRINHKLLDTAALLFY